MFLKEDHLKTVKNLPEQTYFLFWLVMVPGFDLWFLESVKQPVNLNPLFCARNGGDYNDEGSGPC